MKRKSKAISFKRYSRFSITFFVTISAFVIAKFKTREDFGHFTKRLLALPLLEEPNTHAALTTGKKETFNSSRTGTYLLAHAR